MKKNWRLIKTIRIYCQDIGMGIGIEKCTLLVRKFSKKTNSGRNEITETGKNYIVWREGKLLEIRKTRIWHHQKSGYDRKR